jgi:hypothetical protein
MATPFERRVTKRVPSRSVRVSFKGAAGGGPHPGVDLSLEGVGVACPRALASGAQVEMELDHRHAGVLSLNAQVAWAGDVAGSGRVGLQFASLSILQRNHLRRLMAAEVGSCVLEEGRLRGFAVSTAAGAWAVFDGAATKVAVVNQEAVNRFNVSYRPRGAAYEALERHVADGLSAAVARVLSATGPLSFDPPLGPRAHPVTGVSARPGASAPPTTGRFAAPAQSAQPSLSSSGENWLGQGGSAAPPPPPPPAAAPPPPPPPPPPSTARFAPPKEEDGATLSGSAVVVNGEVIGFVALTGKRTWSIYDPQQRQTAVLSNEGAKFTIFWLGGKPEESLESLEADSFPAALAAAFDLAHPPELRSAAISPQQRLPAPTPKSRTQKIPAVRVLFRHRAIGYLRPAPSDGGWTVFDRNKAQIALIAISSGRWRVCVLGASPEDSLDFEDHDEFVEAVQASFKLPELPELDPPIKPAASKR